MNETKTIEQLKNEYEAARMEYEMCDASNCWDILREKMQDAQRAYEISAGILPIKSLSRREQMDAYKARCQKARVA